MKKVININFQGRVIPIEEEAYEELKRYIESLRNHFANEEGREEIINDIENRIAELFTEKMKNSSEPLITEAAVAAIIASIGRPEEFDGDTVDAGSASSSNESSYKTENTTTSRGSLFRNDHDKMLGGVCSGLSAYLRIDTTIVRVIFALFALGAFGTGLLIYIILWAVLPTKAVENKISRRLFRDADQRVIAGVCSGIANYFNIAVWIPRLIFVLPVLLGIFKSVSYLFFIPVVSVSGTLTLTYLILWAVVPKAITASEKMEMKGEKVDLESIKNKVQDELQGVKKNFSENADKWKNDLSQRAGEMKNEAGDVARRFAGEAGPAIKNTGSRFGRFILTLVKVFFFLILSIIAFALLMASFGLIAAGAVVMPLRNFMPDGNWIQVYAWGTLILFMLVPVISLILWLVRVISGTKKRNHYVAYTLGTLWTLGWVSVVLLFASITKQFKRSGQLRDEVGIVQPSKGRMIVEFKDPEGKYYPLELGLTFDDDDLEESEGIVRLSASEDSLLIGNISVRLAKSIDSNFHVSTIKRARASSSRDAEEIAEKITFSVNQVDSILSVPLSFPITTKTKFRNQHVRLEIEVPVGKEIFISNRVNSLMSYSLRTNKDGLTIDWDEYDDDNYLWSPGRWYIMTERGLEKKYKDQGDDDEPTRRKKWKKNQNENEPLEMKIEKELEEHTITSKRSEEHIDQDVESDDVNRNNFQAGRILFSALSLLRVGR
jgi:phage shock protein PspC (stress-responsive transcriptional regulator)